MTDDAPAAGTYTFGDTVTAAERLRLLAELFAPPTRDLLRRWAPQRPEHVVDLGCGPGHSTRLVHEVTGAQRTTGIDRSAAYVAQAAGEAVAGIAFVEHDVTDVPLPVPSADLVFARYLLTHLSDPVDLLHGCAPTLRAGGRLHVLNLRTWRTDAYARAAFDARELDDLSRRLEQLAAAAAPDAVVDHTLGELVLEA